MSRPGVLQRALRAFGCAGFVPAGIRTRIVTRLHSPLTGEGHEFEVPVRGMRYAGKLDSYIDWRIYFFGSYEPYVIDTLELLMRALPPGKRIAWDIGANSGQHTLMMARRLDAVHAFEPFAPVRAQLERNVALNPPNRVTVHPFGLGDADEMRMFHAPDERNLGVGAFDGGFMGKGKSAAHELQLRTGDSVVADGLAPPPGLIKIDVDGLEPSVLKGLRETVARHRPMVLLEYPALAYRTSGPPLSFTPADYVHYAVSNRARGPRLLPAEQGEQNWDSALIPKELSGPVEALAFYPQLV